MNANGRARGTRIDAGRPALQARAHVALDCGFRLFGGPAAQQAFDKARAHRDFRHVYDAVRAVLFALSATYAAFIDEYLTVRLAVNRIGGTVVDRKSTRLNSSHT